MILYTADWHIKLGQKNVPVKWATNRYQMFFEQVYEVEKQQTNNIDIIEDLEYTLRRLTKGRRNIKQLTKDEGLVQGLEKGVIEREVIRPWFSTEFINCLGFFLMTRKPKYWRNGESIIELLHPYSEEIIESLKEGH